MTTKKDKDTRELTIHVIGSGSVGESIVIHLPNGKWGVVDCYASSLLNLDTNFTLQFLLNKQIQHLEFVCLSHPHDDHYRGMSHILQHFKRNITYFWRFGGVHIREILSYLKKDALSRYDNEQTESAAELHKIFKLVRQYKKEDSVRRVTRMSDFKLLYKDDISGDNRRNEIRIFSLGPSTKQIELYQETIKNCFLPDGNIDPNKSKPHHNMVSGVLLIRYGNTQVVLGGDAEKPEWDDILEDELRCCISAHAVKVSHHGSNTGITENLWATLVNNFECYALIVPFKRKHLPDKEAVEHIAGLVKEIYTTSKEAVLFDRDITHDIWEDYGFVEKSLIGEVFTVFKAHRATRPGICSLSFDAYGNCTNIRCYGSAGLLRMS